MRAGAVTLQFIPTICFCGFLFQSGELCRQFWLSATGKGFTPDLEVKGLHVWRPPSLKAASYDYDLCRDPERRCEEGALLYACYT